MTPALIDHVAACAAVSAERAERFYHAVWWSDPAERARAGEARNLFQDDELVARLAARRPRRALVPRD